ARGGRANGAVGYVVRRRLGRSRHMVWTAVGAQVTGSSTFQLAALCLHAGTVAALALAAYLFQRGEATIGTVYLIFAYTESLRRPIEGITRQLQDLQQAAASVGRVRGLLAERSTIADGPIRAWPSGPLAVEL